MRIFLLCLVVLACRDTVGLTDGRYESYVLQSVNGRLPEVMWYQADAPVLAKSGTLEFDSPLEGNFLVEISVDHGGSMGEYTLVGTYTRNNGGLLLLMGDSIRPMVDGRSLSYTYRHSLFVWRAH